MSIPINLIKLISNYFSTEKTWESFKKINSLTCSIYNSKLDSIRLRLPECVVKKFLTINESISLGYCGANYCSTCFEYIDEQRLHSHTKGKYVCEKCNRGYYSRREFNELSHTCEHYNIVCERCMADCSSYRCYYSGCEDCIKKSPYGDSNTYCGYHYHKKYSDNNSECDTSDSDTNYDIW